LYRRCRVPGRDALLERAFFCHARGRAALIKNSVEATGMEYNWPELSCAAKTRQCSTRRETHVKLGSSRPGVGCIDTGTEILKALNCSRSALAARGNGKRHFTTPATLRVCAERTIGLRKRPER